jgi:hypothetical protein
MRRWIAPAARIGLSAAALAVVLAHDVAAVPGVNFAWDACLSDGGVSTRTSSCASDDGEHVAVASFVLAHDQWIQVGIEVMIDLHVDAAALPDWWQFFNTGTCRREALTARFDFTAYPQTQCLDPWTRGTPARGGIAAYKTTTSIPPNDYPDPNRARIIAGFASDTPAHLVAGREYLGFELVIRNLGTSSCLGCKEGVSLVLSELKSVQVDGSSERLQEPIVDYCLKFQAGSVPCSYLPARAITWGQIKSLYR